MLRAILFIICLVFIVSCNSQKTDKSQKDDLLSEKLHLFLGEDDFKILESTEIIVRFDIQKKLIEGTENEYSNTLVIKDTLSGEKTRLLLALVKADSSYSWEDRNKSINFEPSKQFLFKGKTKRLSLLMDNEKGVLGFTTLNGQRLISISEHLSNTLTQF